MDSDSAEAFIPPSKARFIKNLVYAVGDGAIVGIGRRAQTGVFKTMESNQQYVNVTLPAGNNYSIGQYSCKRTNEVFAFIWNSNGNHTIYRINGSTQTYSIVYQGTTLNFQLDPRYFIHEGGAYLDVIYVTDPETKAQTRKTFLFFTDNFNPQRVICVEDSIATQSFSAALFPIFGGKYDPMVMINMGVPTPYDCPTVSEITPTAADGQKNNQLLFQTWQFRIKYYDVWGRPSEHGIISDLYVPGINDCIAANASLPRCLNIVFDVPYPYIDRIDVEYRNCNGPQWYVADTLYLFDDLSTGEWWTRTRNPLVNFNSATNQITYTFCATSECIPVAEAETTRLENALPKKSVSVTKVGNTIALGNNTDGFLPISPELRQKITAVVTPPDKAVENIVNRNITVWCCIYNVGLHNFQSVIKNGTTNFIWGDNNSKHGGAMAYSQYFKNSQQSGFLGYLAGTGNLAISQQYYLDATNQLVLDVDFNGGALSPRHLTFQKFTFNNVPRGTYIFRLASHLVDPTLTSNYETTSTTVWGVCPFNPLNYTVDPGSRTSTQELVINVCDSDYDTFRENALPGDNKMLVIADVAYYSGSLLTTDGKSRAFSGYIYETEQNGSFEFPMELMKLTGASSSSHALVTDHNGFYWYADRTPGRTMGVNFFYKCAPAAFGLAVGGPGMNLNGPITLDTINGGEWSDFATLPCNRVLIEGKITLQGSGIGVPGVPILLTRGGQGVSRSDGTYTVIAHDDVTTESLGGQRQDDLILVNGGSCTYSGLDNGCIDPAPVAFSLCQGACTTRIVTVPNIVIVFLAQRGLLSGGTYGLGVTFYDWLGRATAIQDIGTITIPSVVEAGTIGPANVTINILPGTVFPSEFAYMTFSITNETTIEDYLDWIVDRVEFIDNTGNINTEAPTQIRVYYASLNEYNKQNNFSTTTGWQFLVQNTSNPVVGDEVEFYINGDGTFFTQLVRTQVKYDQTGQFFLINYTSALQNLSGPALMRLIRPMVCTNIQPYFEQCGAINLVNGVPETLSFVLKAFDTYFLYRKIPVPTPIGTTTSTVTTTTSVTTGNITTQTAGTAQQTTISLVDEQKTFGFPFEHHAPSDFWGDRCFNLGRVNTKDPNETESYNLNQIALSDVLGGEGILNFSNYFEDGNKTDFTAQGIEGIVALLPETSVLLVVGQYDNFTVGFSDNQARANPDGTIQVGAVGNGFGRPQTKIGSNYGCLLQDKNTISKIEGLVHWLDASKAVVVQHNFTQGVPISEGGVDSYIRPKIKFIQQYNLTAGAQPKYFIGITNPINYEYLLTDFTIGGSSYLNLLDHQEIERQDTIAFDIRARMCKAHYSFTPEMYCYLEGELNQQQLFTFKGGQPFMHYTNQPNPSWGTFYGETVPRIYRVIMAVDNLKKKHALYFEVYCKQSSYYVRQVLSETGQQSRTLLANIRQAAYFWQGPFFCDLIQPPTVNRPISTGPNRLMDGNNLIGLWFDVMFVGDPAKDNVYTELQGVTIFVAPYEKSSTE